jgi:hypothetical protein
MRIGGRPFTDSESILAIKPADNETFYREVDEEMRRDQMRTIWQRYGKLIIGGIVAALALLAAILWWNQHRENQRAEKSEQLISAFEDISSQKKAAALPKLEALAKSDSPGHRASALLTQAALAIEANDLKKAATLYGQVADDKSLDQVHRDLAIVRRTAVEFDTLQPQAVVDRLKGYAVAGNPWFGSAGEMVALAQLKLNRPQQAAQIFAALAKDKNVPESIRARARPMASSLGVDAVEDPAPATQEGTR